MKNIYNKSSCKKLRQLAVIAHERELAGKLKKLLGQFAEWQAKIKGMRATEQLCFKSVKFNGFGIRKD